MKFLDLVDITKEGRRGVAFRSEDGRWMVTASDLDDAGPFTWCVYQRRRATWVRRLPWLALASHEEAQGVVAFLAAYPFALSPLAARDALEWHVRRAATGLAAVLAVRVGQAIVRRARDRVVRDLAGGVDGGA